MELSLNDASNYINQMRTENNPANASLLSELEKAQKTAKTDGLSKIQLSADISGTLKSYMESKKSALPPPNFVLANFSDAQDTFASLEKMILLFATLSQESRSSNREQALASLEARVKELQSAAESKIEGAKEMERAAVIGFIVSAISAMVSVIGSAVSMNNAANEAVSRAISTLTQGLSGFVSAGAQYANTEGQTANQIKQAEADKMQAKATEYEALQSSSTSYEQEFKDLMKKMNELLNAMLEAKNKSTEAAARA